ncbi:MAG: MBL fold metallo-hydrolase [Fibrobacteria bacterium]|nr:MBL fold metallo-hydrolase [Fibrobacteria bacterium]
MFKISVLIKAQKFFFFCATISFFSFSNAQDPFIIKGTVVDHHWNPVESVLVMLDSTQQFMLTDTSGSFRLTEDSPVSVAPFSSNFNWQKNNSTLSFVTPSSGKLYYTIYNLKGQPILSNSLLLPKQESVQLWLKGLLPGSLPLGVYVVQIKIGKESFSQLISHVNKNQILKPIFTIKESRPLAKTSAVWNTLSISKPGYTPMSFSLEERLKDFGEIVIRMPLPDTQLAATWYMVNVNYGDPQGDAHVITIGEKVVMIDAAYHNEAKTAILPFLRQKGIRFIDEFILSHPHADHYQGVRDMLDDGIRFGNFYMKIPPKDVCDKEIPVGGCNYQDVLNLKQEVENSGATVSDPKTGFRLALPNNSGMEVLLVQEGPSDDMISPAVNDLSIIMKWYVGDNSVLFAGDLGPVLGEHAAKDARMKADILKVPHHGGLGIAPDSFFDRVDPEASLVPAPQWVWCGERAVQARTWSERKKVPAFVNSLHGQVTVKFYGKGYEILTEKESTCP